MSLLSALPVRLAQVTGVAPASCNARLTGVARTSCDARLTGVARASCQIRLALLVPAALLLLLAPAREAAAQRPMVYATIDSLRHIQSVEPRLGPPGTRVEIYTENLPPQAKIHVGIGAMRAGFEALGEGEQQMWGEVSATVRVPGYASWERPLVFIIFNGIFSPIGISDPFHVTNDDGMVQRTGRITDEGLGCVTLRDQDEYMYALTGDLEGLKPGDEVVVEGTISIEGPCDEADSIAVVRWREAG
ncbi:MAG: DUF5818 domain-containing protein [Gemmatimonadota bacterium]|nr:DUF5818 domain-containing protein [Gemmatimonadota bacterium]